MSIHQPQDLQGTEYWNYDLPPIEVEKPDPALTFQLSRLHHRSLYYNPNYPHPHADPRFARISSPPLHDCFPLENPAYPANDVDFDEWTDYAAYCGLEDAPALANILSNEKNASLHRKFFTPRSVEQLVESLPEAVDHEANAEFTHMPDATSPHGSRPQLQVPHSRPSQPSGYIIDYDGFHLQESNPTVPTTTTTTTTNQHQQQRGEQPQAIISRTSPRPSTLSSLIVELEERRHTFTITPARPQNPASLIVKLQLPSDKVAKILAEPTTVESSEEEDDLEKDEDYVDSESEKAARKKAKTSR
ncbi:hypothetical protein SBOR_2193 [Sclerotinia borealis F-4128]|uniref:Uncharacterized protein n=1 Tax=Sclerotinia borealis (strain F-4128) TaxID=1432307 RepID=W9CSF9_SCLBF|nr:hypothetical protein SBOR_2193 [Sclerotinia borealis F-4128]